MSLIFSFVASPCKAKVGGSSPVSTHHLLRRRLNLAGVPRIDWIACEPGLEHLGVGYLERFTAVGELEDVAVEDHEVRRLSDLERPDLLLPAKKARPVDRVSVQDLANPDRLPWIERRAVGVATRHGPRHVD